MMKAKIVAGIISIAMAFGIVGTVAPMVIVLSSMIASPLSAQVKSDQKADTVPPIRKVQIDSVESVSKSDSLIDSAMEKAKQAGKNFTQVEVGTDQVNTKLNYLQIRQIRILKLITPVKIESFVPCPKPVKQIPVMADTPSVKPVEVPKRSWWMRTFRKD